MILSTTTQTLLLLAHNPGHWACEVIYTHDEIHEVVAYDPGKPIYPSMKHDQAPDHESSLTCTRSCFFTSGGPLSYPYPYSSHIMLAGAVLCAPDAQLQTANLSIALSPLPRPTPTTLTGFVVYPITTHVPL